LKQKIAGGEVETILTVFPDMYGRLVGKRITGDFFIESTAGHGMHACDYLLTVDMEMDVIEGYKFANWESGYGDFHCVPDFDSLRMITWLDKSALVMCDLETEPGHQPVQEAPRTMLKRQIERLAEAGYSAKSASEIEYFIFKDSYESAREKNYTNLETFGWYIEDYHMFQATKAEALNGAIRKHMDNSGIPVEFGKGEWGPGQHELNLRYTDVLEMADRHAIYKQGVKEIALTQGLAVSFMAKWRTDLAGSSMHLHLSLWDKGGNKNVFPGEHKAGPIEVSNEFRWFLGGWMAHAPEIVPFYAPNPNSYKRYVDQSWAPTKIAWSYDNRTSGFRIVGNGSALRIECRIPGADTNPYLAYAATIAAGLDGIENRIEPSDIFQGDVYAAAELPSVPGTLRDATDELENSGMLREAFGNDVVDHYVHSGDRSTHQAS
jgi:glutamine synthetase